MKSILASLIVTAALLAVGCDTTSNPVTPEPTTKTLISSTTVDGITVELFADKAFVAGYNPVYVRLLRGTTLIKDARVNLNPIMDMGTMKHSCPTVQPGEDPDAEGLFTGAVIYTMAGSSDEWSLAITVDDGVNNTASIATFPVAVVASSTVKSVKIDGQDKTIITLMPRSWTVGMNDVQFLAHTTTDGFTFVPKTDLVPRLTPTMPSMGHGSNGNVNPVHQQDGLYKGKVNLTMTGNWDLEFAWMQSDSSIKVNFPILVP